MHSDTCVIIPVYNEAEALQDVLTAVKRHFRHVICVDDGSTDNSVEVLNSFDVEVVQHARNQGQGAALRTGLQHALQNEHYKYFVTFDADGQHSVDDAVRMVRYIHRHGVDIVLGSRFLGQTKDIAPLKKLVLKLAIWFSNVTTRLKLTDTHNGLRVFDRRVASNLRLTCHGMAHASEIIYRVAEHHFRYVELPVTITYTDYSKHKRSTIKHTFDVLKELLVYRLQRDN